MNRESYELAGRIDALSRMRSRRGENGAIKRLTAIGVQCALFGVAKCSICGTASEIEWVTHFRRTGSVAPSKIGGYKPKTLSGAHRDWLLQRCHEKAFTLCGLVAELGERGVKVDYRSVWKFVHSEGLSFKKTVGASEQDRPDVARRRLQWWKYQRQIDPSRLVFIDETWTKTNMAPLRGWTRRGRRLKAKVPHGDWKTMTFLAALRRDRIDAPCVFDGPINGERFLLYVEKMLVSTLRPGDIVITATNFVRAGTISAVIGAKPSVRRSARRVPGCFSCRNILPIPTFAGTSLNPIEQVFAKIKHWLRKAAARSFDAVCSALGDILTHIPAQECANYFKQAGYERD